MCNGIDVVSFFLSPFLNWLDNVEILGLVTRMNVGYIGIQLYDFELQHLQTILLIGFLRQHKVSPMYAWLMHLIYKTQ